MTTEQVSKLTEDSRQIVDAPASVFVALGANLIHPKKTIQQALVQLEALSLPKSFRFSKIYRTEPVSPIPQADFVNAVCTFQTNLDPFDLQAELQQIERRLGKQLKQKEAARQIDLDLLFYDQLSFSGPQLTLPHPHWSNRLFVLIPLKDLVDVIPLTTNGKQEYLALNHLIANAPQHAIEVIS